jgi:DNA-binding transcriptional MerR regulator
MSATRAARSTAETRARPARYPIRAVSKLTGVGIDTLRAWERRYGAVTPERGRRGRLYGEADVARLRLIHQLVLSGHAVGQVAALGDRELRRLAAPSAPAGDATAPAARTPLDTSAFTSALSEFDSAAIDRAFSRLAAVLDPLELVRDVVLPALRDVGDHWRRRRGGIAHEHLLSSAMRHLLGSFLRLYARRESAMALLFATPSGDRHEIGILSAAMLAASRGLRVSYVGPDLPAPEMLAAVKLAGARVLVLGLTLTGNGEVRELRRIVRALPAGVQLWAGGPGAKRHARLLQTRGLVLHDLDAFLLQLSRLAGSAR